MQQNFPNAEDYFSPTRCMQWADVDVTGKVSWHAIAQSRNFAAFTGLQNAIAELPNDADTKICFYAGRLREAALACANYKGPLKLEPLHETLVRKVIRAVGAHNGPNLPMRLDKALYVLYGINCVRADAGLPPVGQNSIVISAFYIHGLSETRKALQEQLRSTNRELSNEARDQLANLHASIATDLGADSRLCEELLKGCATSIDLAIRLHDCLMANGAPKRIPPKLEDALGSCMDTARPMAIYERFGARVPKARLPAPYVRP